MKTMTPAQKRVAIAKDVIAQVKAKTYIPRSGFYILPEHEFAREDMGQNLQSLIPAMGRCEVCADGAAVLSAVLSAVRLFNHHKVDSTDRGIRNIYSTLEKWFSQSQARAMEFAFENCGSGFDGTLLGYADEIPDDTERLVAIFRNIIRNRGTFKPTTKDFPKARELATV